jgi:outer membrane protein assembly factor BamB
MKKVPSILLTAVIVLSLAGLFTAPRSGNMAGGRAARPEAPAPRPLNITIKPDEIAPEARLDKFSRFSWQVYVNGVKTNGYERDAKIRFDLKGDYTEYPMVTAFRGGHFHDRPYYGSPEITEAKLAIVWSKAVGAYGKWTGVGWNGQPSVVKWDDDTKRMMNLREDKKDNPGLKEVIYGAMDGNIYFLDLDDGSETRKPIRSGCPVKGSVSVDPRGYPLLMTGQGLSGAAPLGFRIYSLIDQKQLFFQGADPQAGKLWGGHDSTGILDPGSDTFIQCGENGVIYIFNLNTDFDREAGAISIRPETAKFVYSPPFRWRHGIEGAPAAYGNLLFSADNGGFLLCLDLNSLRPVWGRDVTDDTDATIAIGVEGGGRPFLYTACEVDGQGRGGFSHIRKINALTGELLWEHKIPCAYDPEVNGGALATPVIGQGEIDDLVIFNIAKTENSRAGKLLAYGKADGGLVWQLDMAHYSWSSPTVIYAGNGKPFIVQCDSEGGVFLIDARDGAVLDSLTLNGNVEGSPVLFEDMIVVGTRGQKIYGIRIA